jgi:SCF-associated factor 1
MDQEGNQKARLSDDGVIPCVTWNLQKDPVRLPAIPHLPELRNTGDSGRSDEETQLIQIAGGDQFIIGLTNKGHVLKFAELDDEITTSHGRWEYVSGTVCPLSNCFWLIYKKNIAADVQ